MKPAFTVTILAADGVTELECRVWAYPAEPSVGIRSPQFDVEPDEPRRVLSDGEHERALAAAQGWRPW